MGSLKKKSSTLKGHETERLLLMRKISWSTQVNAVSVGTHRMKTANVVSSVLEAEHCSERVHTHFDLSLTTALPG